MKTINTDEMYLIRQPKHASMSIINLEGINTKNPLPDDIHEMLDVLESFSDIVFIFPRTTPQRLNKDKFSKLYKACAWTVVGDNSPKTLVKVFNYAREIFKSHVQFNLAFADDLGNFKTPEKLSDIKTLQMQNPVLNINRYNSDVFFEIYNTPEESGAYAAYYTDSPVIRLGIQTVDVFRELSLEFVDSFASFSKEFIPSTIKWLGLEYIGKDIKEL